MGGPFNLLWFSGFQNELLNGELIPRYAIPWDGHFGSVAFYFYGPAPFYIKSVVGFIIPGNDVIFETGVSYLVMHILSCLSAYFSMRYLTNDGRAALFAAAIYATVPFHMQELVERGGVASATTYIFAPMVIAGLARLARSGRGHWLLALSVFGMAISHLPNTLLLLLGLPFLALYFARETETPVRYIVTATLTVGLGLAIAAFSILPALLLQGEISPHRWDFSEPADTLFFQGSEWRDQRRGMAVMFASNLLVFLSLLGAYAVASFLSKTTRASETEQRSAPRKEQGSLHLFPLFIFAGAVFFFLLMVPVSRLFWENVPILPKIQFSWRVLAQSDLFLMMTALLAAGAAFKALGVNKTWLRHVPLAGLTAAIAVNIAGSFYISERWSIREEQTAEIDAISSHTEIARDPAEYVPAGVELGEGHLEGADYEAWLRDAQDAPDITVTDGEVDTNFQSESGRRFTISVSAEAPATLQIKRLFLSTWTLTTSDGADLNTRVDDETGFIITDVPAGAYEIYGELKMFPAERLGLAMSFLALILLGILSTLSRAFSNRRPEHELMKRTDEGGNAYQLLHSPERPLAIS